MKQIDSSYTLNRLLVPYFRKKHPTNQLQLPGKFYDKIARRILYYEKNEAGLFLYEDMEHYYRFYYYLDHLDAPISITQSKPLVAEIPWRSDRTCPEPDISFWAKCGFIPMVERERMTVRAENFSLAAASAEISFADTNMYEEIFDLLSGVFDRYVGFLPSKYELETAMAENRVLCARVQNKTLAGVLHFGQDKQVSTLWHLAVAKAFRNCGVAEGLLGYWRNVAADTASLYRLWVAVDNAVAQTLYHKFGFRPDELLCSTLFME